MRYPSSTRRSYREVLIAAGLTAALGVGTACAEPGAADAPQAGGQASNGQNPTGSVDCAAVPRPSRADELPREFRR
jgi:uncharacterized membrane protein